MQNQISKILLVEDDQDQAALIRRVFESEEKNVQVVTAVTLEDARAFLSRSLPDAILTDMYLPDGYGIQLLEMSKLTPIVLMSCSDDHKLEEEAYRCGAVGYIRKASVNAFDIPRMVKNSLLEWKRKNLAI